MCSVNIKDILEYLDTSNQKYSFLGNSEDFLLGYSSLYEYKEDTITWAKNLSNLDNSGEQNIRLIILPFSEELSGVNTNKDNRCKNIIFTNEPRRLFFHILDKFYKDEEVHTIGVNNCISASAKIGQNVNIGNNCTIEDFVEIGDNTVILNNVVISKKVKIGANCVIKSGAVIGEYGLGYVKEDDGTYKRVPHMGSVVIGDYVDIGANTTIERGVMQDTTIEEGTKIDDLCQISHNVHIGKNVMIVVNSSIYGSVNIGHNSWIASAIIKNHVTIGDRVTVGMGSVVTKDIPSDSTAYGIPAKIYDDRFKEE